jgi:hypothetical protein
MKSAPYPSYSPDLAPSDFSLFGYVKRCLAGLSFEDADQLFAAVEGVLDSIEEVTLQAVFLEWMDRLRKCIATNREYTELVQIKIIEEWSFILSILRSLYPGGTPCMPHSMRQQDHSKSNFQFAKPLELYCLPLLAELIFGDDHRNSTRETFRSDARPLGR